MIYQIAIDGPAGAGKSTIARMVAQTLNFEYVDTGAMYRALTLKALNLGIDLTKEDSFNFISETNIDFENGKIILDSVDVTNKIRSLEVSNNVSLVSTYASVRTKLVAIQRRLAESKNCVLDGRDIGTVVLPDADLKIFLTASVEERARRRLNERSIDNDQSLTLEETIQEIKQRDYLDSTREISPLQKADDAIEIDSSSMSIQEVIDKIISLFTKRGYSMENLEQKDSKQTNDQVEETDQTLEVTEETQETVKEDNTEESVVAETEEVTSEDVAEEDVDSKEETLDADESDEEVTEEDSKEETSQESDEDDVTVEADSDEEDDEDYDEDEEDEDEELEEPTKTTSKEQPRKIRPYQLVTGTVVRILDAVDARVDNFGRTIGQGRDARVLFDIGDGINGILNTADIANYDGQDLHELFPEGMETELIVKQAYPRRRTPLLSTVLLEKRENLNQFNEIVENTEIITAKVMKVIPIGLILEYKDYPCLLPTSQIVSGVEAEELVGKEIDVCPIRIDYNRIRLVVSQTVAEGKKARQKQLEYIDTLEIGQVFTGLVKNIERYGAFVQIKPGVEGLLHISEIAHERVFNIEKFVKVGDEVEVEIIHLKDDRIGLSRKNLIPNYWKDLIDSLSIDDVVTAKVAEINKSGVVVEFEHNINGFLPKSEFAWERDVFIEDYVSIGDEIELQVIELDLAKKRIILSRKRLQENPWDLVDLRQNDKIDIEVGKKLPEGFKVLYNGIMGYLPNSNVDEDKIAIEDIKEGLALEVNVRAFDRSRTRFIVSMKDRPQFVPRHRESNYSRQKDTHEAFTSTFGDLIADSLKDK